MNESRITENDERASHAPVQPETLTAIGGAATGEMPGTVALEYVDVAAPQTSTPENETPAESKRLTVALIADEERYGSIDGTESPWGHPTVAIHPKHVRQLKKVPGNYLSSMDADGNTTKQRAQRARAARRRNNRAWREGDSEAWNRAGTQRIDKPYRDIQIGRRRRFVEAQVRERGEQHREVIEDEAGEHTVWTKRELKKRMES